MSFCKLKNEKIMFIWSDNTTEKSMHLFPREMAYGYDIESDTPEIFLYSEIEMIRCDFLGNKI